MNPNLKDLRVYVIPCDTVGHEIDQRSSVEEIMSCDQAQIFSVPDYFQAQNDEEITFTHWSFLINIKTKEDCTGMNTKGIDYY